jgi:hypothetical protein
MGHNKPGEIEEEAIQLASHTLELGYRLPKLPSREAIGASRSFNCPLEKRAGDKIHKVRALFYENNYVSYECAGKLMALKAKDENKSYDIGCLKCRMFFWPKRFEESLAL